MFGGFLFYHQPPKNQITTVISITTVIPNHNTYIIPDPITAVIPDLITAVIPDPDRESRYPVKPGMTKQYKQGMTSQRKPGMTTL